MKLEASLSNKQLFCCDSCLEETEANKMADEDFSAIAAHSLDGRASASYPSFALFVILSLILFIL